RRHGAEPGRRAGRVPGGRARARGDLLRGRAGAGARDDALDGGGGGEGGAARRRPAARAHPSLDPLLGRRRGPGGAGRLPGYGRAPRLRRRGRAVPRARIAAAREGGRTRSARRGRIIRAGMTAMVQVAVAGDVTEAEEIQAILANVGIESELSTPAA